MSFSKSFSLRLARDVGVIVMALGNNVMLTRFLGAEGRGQYAILSTTAILLTLFFGQMISRSNSYLVGKDRSRAGDLFANSMLYSLGVGLFLTLCFFLLVSGFRDLSIGGLFGLAVGVAVVTVLLHAIYSIFLGMDRMIEFNTVPVVAAFLYLCGNVFVLWGLKLGLKWVMLNWLIASLFAFILGFWLLFRLIGIKRRFSGGLFKESLKVGSKGMVVNVLVALLFRVDIFLVDYFLGHVSAGVYSIAIVFAEMLMKVPNVAANVLFPKVSADSVEGGDRLTAKVNRLVILLTVCMGLLMVLIGWWIIPAIFGVDFEGAYIPLVFMMPGILAAASGSIIGTNLWTKGYPNVTMIAAGSGLALNVILNLILIPRFGLVGAGLATSAAYILWSGSIFRYFVQNTSVSSGSLIFPKTEDFAFMRLSIKWHSVA